MCDNITPDDNIAVLRAQSDKKGKQYSTISVNIDGISH
jgi:hypothetical protein